MDIEKEYHRVFFPLAGISAPEQGLTLALLKWCEDNMIDIVHTVDAMATMATSKIMGPQGQNAGGAMMTMTFFYGACDDEEHFKKIFGLDYNFKNATGVPNIVTTELQKMGDKF